MLEFFVSDATKFKRMTTPKLVTIGLPMWKRLKYLPHVPKIFETRDKTNLPLGKTGLEAITLQLSYALTRLLARPYKQKRPPSRSVAIWCFCPRARR